MEYNKLRNYLLQNANNANKWYIDLCNKSLTKLPPEIKELKNSKKLLINKNQLQNLPPEVGELKTEVGELKNLECLDIGNNQLQNLPPEIGELKELSTLKIKCKFL